MSRLVLLFADASTAVNQAGLLLVAAFLLCIGALLAGNRLYWRLKGTSVAGRIVGVRALGKKRYYPVYRYKLPTGARREATSDTARSPASGLETGRKVRLLVLKQHPDRVADAEGQILEILGGFCFTAAGVVLYIALTEWPFTALTWTLLAIIALFLLRRLRRSIPSRGEVPFASVLRKTRPEKLLEIPARPMEDILGAAGLERQRRQRETGRIVTPILVLVGVAVLALGLYLGRTAFLLQSTGERVQGTVVFFEQRATLHGSSYYPVVQFGTRDGRSVQFRDRMGSNPPAYREGDSVGVLYFRASPEHSATIDRGVLNWVAPGALCLVGAALTMIALRVRLGVPHTLQAS